MSLTNPEMLFGGAAAAAAPAEPRSLRFNHDDDTYLSFTPSGTATSNTKWTLSFWVKKSAHDGGPDNDHQQVLWIDYESTGVKWFEVRFTYSDCLDCLLFDGSSEVMRKMSKDKFRDPHGWFHVVITVDSTAAADDRLKMYVNNRRITEFHFSANGTGSMNTYMNTSGKVHYIGRGYDASTSLDYADFYLAEMYMIDGQAKQPSDFAETDSATDKWIPKTGGYTGTYGNNGWYLDFGDASDVTATTLGKDSSGNGNNWTPNNFSVTAGIENDVFYDYPADSGTDTGKGGEVKGTYCTLSPWDKHSDADLRKGNLYHKREGAWKHVRGTIGVLSGKFYWECEAHDDSGTPHGITGICNKDSNFSETYGSLPTGVHAMYVNATSKTGMHMDGNFNSEGNLNFTAGNVIGVALDMDSSPKTVRFYRNGVIDSAATTIDFEGHAFPWTGAHNVAWYMNFGQRPFKYDNPGTNRPAATFKALCSTNLTTPDIVKPKEHFDVALYTGTGSGLTVSSLSFQPDFTWIKSRSNSSHNHLIYDDIRGSTKYLSSNGTGHGDTANLAWTPTGTGFTISTNSNYNTNNDLYVSWNWKAPTSQGNSNGENITVANGKQQVNTTAGFSITQYEGDGTGANDQDSGDSVGHGLNSAPEWVMIKRFDLAVNNWVCWHPDFGNAKMIHINTNGARSGTNYCIPTAPTSTKVDLGDNPEVNKTGDDYMMYCWHGVEGFSKMGTYEGGVVGTFVYTGFQPRFLWVKNSDMGPSDWTMLDTEREAYNPNNNWLPCNHGGPEGQQQEIDIFSNGFRLMSTSEGSNHNSGTYIYMAWAEKPLKYANGR